MCGASSCQCFASAGWKGGSLSVAGEKGGVLAWQAKEASCATVFSDCMSVAGVREALSNREPSRYAQAKCP